MSECWHEPYSHRREFERCAYGAKWTKGEWALWRRIMFSPFARTPTTTTQWCLVRIPCSSPIAPLFVFSGCEWKYQLRKYKSERANDIAQSSRNELHERCTVYGEAYTETNARREKKMKRKMNTQNKETQNNANIHCEINENETRTTAALSVWKAHGQIERDAPLYHSSSVAV